MAAQTVLEGSSMASPPRVQSVIKAVAFDAFAIFDVRSISRLVEKIVPEHGAALSEQWRLRQFEYTWLRNAMHAYKDFWHVTEDALNYASKQTGVNLSPNQKRGLINAYLELKPWPDVHPVLRALQQRGMRLALLTNWTEVMQHTCLQSAGLATAFELQLSTDRVRAYKPDPIAYQMGPEAFRLRQQEIVFVAFGGWDAAGAKSFGFPTYWVNRLDSPSEELGVFADATHRDLSTLPRFLDSLSEI